MFQEHSQDHGEDNFHLFPAYHCIVLQDCTLWSGFRYIYEYVYHGSKISSQMHIDTCTLKKFLYCCIDFIQDHLDVREHVQLLRALQAYLVFLDFLELLDPLVHSIMLAITV